MVVTNRPSAVLLTLYPQAAACVKAGHHIGPTTETFYMEHDDDREYLMIVPRCESCGVPVGGERYATPQEEDKYYKEIKS